MDNKLQYWREKFGLSYHVSYSFEAEKHVGLKNKDILEIGGKLPKGFVFDALNVRSWTSIEAPEYIEQLSHSKISAQIGKEDINRTAISSLPNVFTLNENDYNYYHCPAENIPSTMHEKFDIVFSIACFEHILNFDNALNAMYLALKPGGKLFTMFSPIWSSYNGHHLPPITDKDGNTFMHNNSPIPPWGHLTMRPPELFRHLLKHTDSEAAEKIIYYVYHSSAINRYYTDDYINFFKHSSFDFNHCTLTFPSQLAPNDLALLQRLHPACSHFENNGILVVLNKPQ